MATTSIINRSGESCSLLISFLKNVSGNFESTKPFLIKNNGEESIELEVKLVDNNDYIKTVIDIGWNPELCVGIKGATSDIQIGR